jgi:hypothetical protein
MWTVLVEAEVSDSFSIINLALKMETARFSETLASTNQSTRRFNRKEHLQKT